MRKASQLLLSTTSLVALLSAIGCSSDGGDDGGGPGVNAFGPGVGGSTGVAGATSVAGTGGAPVGVAGGSAEGQGGAALAGVGGSAIAVGGAAGAGPVTDLPPQAAPGGYFESGAWRGYAWTGDDALNIGTTRSVVDFSEQAAGSPFCLEGVVGPDPDTDADGPLGYRGVALLGFNVQQEAFAPVEGQEPPIGSIAPTGLGVAVNYTKTAGATLRIQLQGPDGETDANQRWCAELTAVQGPAFIPYTDFRTSCWLAPGAVGSVAYAMQPIAAVVMTIPGDATAAIPYNVCVAGFADGASVADAPTSISLPAGILTGTLSGEAAKVKVVGRDGNAYVVNNNAWGVNSGDGTQQLRFTANSFEILRQTAGPGGDSSPASFPSIYIGANGAQSGVNGATTTGDNLLPIQVSAITSVPTTFRHNATSGDYNATYDVWFAPSAPQAEYDTALAAFLMVWTYKPGSRVAIGTSRGQATVGGRTWELFVGPRGGGGADANLPVISYVNTGAAVPDYSFDLKAFIDDAVARNVGLTTGMFLTDVFAGFEIWNGGTGLRVDEFTAVVNP
jgi:glycosyl hydrolase family 12